MAVVRWGEQCGEAPGLPLVSTVRDSRRRSLEKEGRLWAVVSRQIRFLGRVSCLSLAISTDGNYSPNENRLEA